MLYKFPREDFQVLISHDFSKRFLKGEITFRGFSDWLDGFKDELEQHKVLLQSIETFRELIAKNPENLLFLELFDGTKIPRNGEILGMVLLELSKYQEILIYPEPGKQDTYGYGFVNAAIENAYETTRKQINLTQLSRLLISVDIIDDNPFSNKIFILGKDMYTPERTNNWCYGQIQPITSFKLGELNFNILFSSTARIRSEAHLFDLFAHELGHMLNVAPAGRINTVESLGSHCTNDLCVMQQKIEAEEAFQYATLRHKRKAPVFCGQCQEDLKKYKPNLSLKDLVNVKFS